MQPGNKLKAYHSVHSQTAASETIYTEDSQYNLSL